MQQIKIWVLSFWDLLKQNLIASREYFINGWRSFLSSSWKIQLATVIIALSTAWLWPFIAVCFATQAAVDSVDMEIGTIMILIAGSLIGMISVIAMELVALLSLPVIHNLILKFLDKVKERIKAEEAYA